MVRGALPRAIGLAVALALSSATAGAQTSGQDALEGSPERPAGSPFDGSALPATPVPGYPLRAPHGRWDIIDGGSRMLHVGGRLGTARVRGGARDLDAALGVGVGTENLGVFVWRDGTTLRVRAEASLGGADSTLEAGALYAVSFGLRGPLARGNALFARLGLEGEVYDGAAVYRSGLVLPELQAGYQWSGTGLFVELAPTAGFVVDGRYGIDEAGEIDTGPSFAPGAIVLVHARAVRLSGVYRAPLEAGRPAGAARALVHDARGSLCVGPGRYAACTGVRYLQSAPEIGPRLESYELSLSIGLGSHGVGPLWPE